MSLEIVILVASGVYTDMWRGGAQDYLSDVITTLVPDARTYLQPEIDTNGLQVWLDTVYRKGYASLDAQNIFDSPAAKIIPGSVMTVLAPDGRVLAQSPAGSEATFTPLSLNALSKAQKGDETVFDLYAKDSRGNYWMAVPIFQKDHKQPVLGVLILTIAPAPKYNTAQLANMILLILLAGVIMLLAIAPLGTIFGFIFSLGLTNRLKRLTNAAEAWGEGNFAIMPPLDRSTDEIGQLSLKMREMAEKVSNLLQDQKALAQMKERNRLAQELHDTVRQQNFATLMQIRAARNQLVKQPEAAAQALVEAESLLKNTQNQLSLLIGELRPPELEGKGLDEALKGYLQNWSQRACIPADIQVTGSQQLPFETEKALFRVVQEALANISRHSRATAVKLTINYLPQETRLSVQDNGVGFDPKRKDKTGFGLESMRQRMTEIGGRLEIESSAESGTCITAVITGSSGKGEKK